MTNYQKIKLAHMVAAFSVVATLSLAFDPLLLLLGLFISWLFWCMGLAICLHKYASHRTFETRNILVKYIILWFGTTLTMGSTINFAAGHRQHHKHADTPEDPYCLAGNFWHKIKLFFYWFPTYKISPLIIKDLLRDKEHTFFNDNYWKILLVYPVILLLIDPVWFGYFYALPVVYTVFGMGYVTVWAHTSSLQQYGTRLYATTDNSWNSWLFSILLAGEGYHNTHHAFPGKYNYETQAGDLDISGRIIELLKVNYEK
jgi:stearoyl-CoA desaturase (delta-9 desaturase)